jgi:hypothetical protein
MSYAGMLNFLFIVTVSTLFKVVQVPVFGLFDGREVPV